MKKLIIPFLLVLSLVSPATAIAPTKPREIDEFRRVEVTHIPVIYDRFYPSNTLSPRPQVKIRPVPIITDLTTPELLPQNKNRINGVASWYCLSGISRCTYTHSSGNYAAIRRDLLWLRGQYINVCTDPNNCVRVKVIDCNCGKNANLIDLYSDAFRQLAPLSLGRIKVYIEYGGNG